MVLSLNCGEAGEAIDYSYKAPTSPAVIDVHEASKIRLRVEVSASGPEFAHWSSAVPLPLRTQLRAQGFKVVEKGQADVVVRLVLSNVQTFCSPCSTGGGYTLMLANATDDTLIFRSSGQLMGAHDAWPEQIANTVVDATIRSPELLALTQGRPHNAPSEVSPLVATTPQPVAAYTQAASTQSFSWPDLSVRPAIAPEGEKDAALIVGVDDYLLVPKVPGATKNATDWYLYLVEGRKVPVSQVRILRDHDATRESILAKASEVGNLAKPGGLVWVVFIGHGAPSQDGKEGVLVGVDAQQTSTGLYARSVRQSELAHALGENRQTVMVIDACFSGRAGNGEALASELQPLIVTTTKSVGTTTLLTAGTNDQFAGPLPGLGRPAFSYLVLGALRGWNGGSNGTVTAQDAIDYATKALTVLPIGRSQTPQLVGGATSLVLARNATEKGPSLASAVSGAGNGGSALPASGATGSNGVVDVAFAVQTSRRGQVAAARLHQLFEARQRELNDRQEVLKKQSAEIDRLKASRSADENQRLVDQWKKDLASLQSTFSQYNEGLTTEQKHLTDPIFNDLLKLLPAVAASHEFHAIYDKVDACQVARPLVGCVAWAQPNATSGTSETEGSKPRVNVTDEVIRALDAQAPNN